MMQRLLDNSLKRLLARKASLVWMLGASLWLWAMSSSSPLVAGDPIRYPGAGMLRIRRESLAQGVWVEEGQVETLRTL